MSKILLEGGIIVLLVLIGISVFIPDGGNNINDVIVDFENSVESGDVVNDGELNDVEISEEYDANFIAKMNCKVANLIVDGLNSVFELGMNVLRHIIN